MPNYDFLNLSPSEFEQISRDLLQKELKITLESFTSGRDNGIDLRYSKGSNSLIVQCKRYENYNSLFNAIKKEVDKVIALKPSVYIVTTSVGLTPNQKDIITNLFVAHVKELVVIYGRDDLNNLLGLFPDIESKHFKLWLSSANVISNILKSKIYNAASFERENINESIKLYVDNESFQKAVTILKDKRYVVISGIPGIGKTTLARILVYYFLSIDYEEFIFLSDSVDDGYEIFNPNKKQVFLFDDFLGSNFLENKLDRNEDSRLVGFIEQIKKHKNKILILTTREYILTQAKQKYEKLEKSSIDLAKCIIDLETYSRINRAKILYNHLYFSSLPEVFLNEILKNKRYNHIINHKNYNPRLIEGISKEDVWSKINPEDYFDFVKKILANPEDIWKHAFINQISDLSKVTLMCLISFNDLVMVEDLRKTVMEFAKVNTERHHIDYSSFNFSKSLKELEGTFINIERDKNNSYCVSFKNPSVFDFLINYLRDNLELIDDMLRSSVYFNQLFDLYDFDPDSNKPYKKIPVDLTGDLGYIKILKEKYTRVLYIKTKKIYYDNMTDFLLDRSVLYDDSKAMLLLQKMPHSEILELLPLLAEEFDQKIRYQKYFDIDNIVEIVKFLKGKVNIDELEIIINAESRINTIEDLNSFCMLKGVFEDSFNLFLEEDENIYDNVRDIFRQEIDSDDDMVEEQLEKLEEFEKILDFRFPEIKEIILDKIDEMAKVRIDVDDDDDAYDRFRDSFYEENSEEREDRIISDMFDGLRDS